MLMGLFGRTPAEEAAKAAELKAKRSADDQTRQLGKFQLPPNLPIDGGDEEEVTEATLAVSSARPVLKKLEGPQALKEASFLSITGITTIGRGPDNDIVIPEDAASSKHCRIEQEGKTFVLVDLGSTNKTWVNGVEKARVVLRNGDKIRIGDTTLAFALFGDRA